MAQLIEQFGGEGFADATDLFARTSMNTLATQPVELTTLSVFGVATEKWLGVRDTSSSALRRHFGRTTFPTVQPIVNAKETETSFAMYFDATPTSGSDGDRLFGQTIGAQNGVFVRLIPSVASGLENEIAVVFVEDGTGVGTTVPTGLLAEAGKVFYVTVRTRGETAVGASDGAYEVYINEQLVDSQTNVDWSSFAAYATNDIGSIQWYGTIEASNVMFVRNVSVWDGWSTADTEAPKFKHVQDMVVTTATPDGDFTNEGGAADATTAVSDDVDTTYLASNVPSAEVVLEYTPDPKVSAFDVAEVFTRLRVARDSVALNTIDVALELTGGLPVVNQQHTITSIAPARENVNLTLSTEGQPPVSATGFQIKITNGLPPAPPPV